MELFIARQPIYDRENRVYGYEILYRSSADNRARFDNPERATSQVLMNLLMDIGLQSLVGNHQAFVNYTRDFLTADIPMLFPPGQVTIEILEDVQGDEPVVAAAKRLAGLGYDIALDDFIYSPEKEPLLAIARIVKIDISLLSDQELVAHVDHLRRPGIRLLAEKVETETDRQRCAELGFDLYQGYYYCRPKLLQRRRMAANQVALLRLISHLQTSGNDAQELQKIISSDVTLTYRLLRYINSAFFGLRRKIESIHQAIVYLGSRNIASWASVIALSGLADGHDERMHLALVRARFCEQLALKLGDLTPASCFTVGLLSVTDAMLDVCMADVVEGLPLAPEVSTALVSGTGRMGELLNWIVAHERAEEVTGLLADVSGQILAETYLEALRWAMETALQMHPGNL